MLLKEDLRPLLQQRVMLSVIAKLTEKQREEI
jgi:hypothetical protein